MNFIICEVTINDVIEINNMLTSLIQDERKKYNSNINENYKVKSFYEQFLENENMCVY